MVHQGGKGGKEGKRYVWHLLVSLTQEHVWKLLCGCHSTRDTAIACSYRENNQRDRLHWRFEEEWLLPCIHSVVGHGFSFPVKGKSSGPACQYFLYTTLTVELSLIKHNTS